MNIQDLKSKSDINSPNLIDHSILTARISIILYDLSNKINDNELRTSVFYTGLFHDIGKATKQFQDVLTNSIDETEYIDNDNNKSKYKYLHNEIGWSFLSNKIQDDFILNNVYYSHGIYNLKEYYNSDIKLKNIDRNTIQNLFNYLIKYNNSYNIKLNEDIDDIIKKPNYYEQFGNNMNQIRNKNNKMLYLRSILRYADALASSNIFNISSTDNDIREYIIDLKKSNNIININDCQYLNTERFNEQLQISDEIGKTTLLKAPTGFGKTLVGLLWFAKHKEKMLWVCPTNNLSYGIYKSILNELKLFGDNKVSVQLYLTSEVKESNCNCEDFEADIVITNLDNYLKPNIDASYGSRLYNIYNRKTVFDEIQEYITEVALFACFMSTMNIRHRYINTETLCLSATPLTLFKYWDKNTDNKTIILPNEEEHYQSKVNQYITINCIETNEEIDKAINTSDIIISNSVSETQRKKKEYNKDLIIHNRYLDLDKKEKISNILDVFGKNSNIEKTLSSSLIIQSGFDISTKSMLDSVLSPESTLQRIGRIDRWDSKNGGIYNCYLSNNKGEKCVVNILYNEELREKWYNSLKEINGKTLSLNDLYIFYNKFILKYKDDINNNIDVRLNKSFENLYCINYTKSTKKESNKDNGINANSNVLRINGNEIFCLFQDETGRWMDEAINCKVYKDKKNGKDDYWDGGTRDQNLLNAYFNMAKKELKNLLNNSNFNYDKKMSVARLNKLKGVDTLRFMAVNSKTPYLRFDKIYSKEFGIIEKD
jgi:superfamily II DNA or RNA helicase